MAIVNASVTDCPHTTFSASAQWDDAALQEIFDSVRLRAGQVPALDENHQPILDPLGQPTKRDMTNAECARYMVGTMMVTWAKAAATDKSARLTKQAAEIVPATWTTLT